MKNLNNLIALYRAMTRQGKVITWFAGILIAIFILDWLF
tara:strand:- start:466 stop:582 length:117 start_codon:yes stop_codon:yes gene_type:complete